MNTYILEGWQLSELLGGIILKGYVFGNPKFLNNSYINTSIITNIVLEKDKIIATTINNNYICYLSTLNRGSETTKIQLLEYFVKDKEKDKNIIAKINKIFKRTPQEIIEYNKGYKSYLNLIKNKCTIPANSVVLCLDTNYKDNISGIIKSDKKGYLDFIVNRPYLMLEIDIISYLIKLENNNINNNYYFEKFTSIEFYNFCLENYVDCYVVNLNSKPYKINSKETNLEDHILKQFDIIRYEDYDCL